MDRNLRTMPNIKRYFAKAKYVERLLHLFALDLKSTPISFCRCPLHGLCRVYALAAGPNIYSTFVLQFLLIMMMLDPLLLIPCLEIRRFLGAIERRLRSVCAIPHPNGHCYCDVWMKIGCENANKIFLNFRSWHKTQDTPLNTFRLAFWLFLFKWTSSTNTKYFASWVGWNIEILIVLSCSFFSFQYAWFLNCRPNPNPTFSSNRQIKMWQYFQRVFSLYDHNFR